MKINVEKCAQILKEQDNILILTHAHPDGDTLGCGFALCRALLKCGKKARVICADEIQKKYDYLYSDLEMPDFKEEYIVAVDVATENLLGDLKNNTAAKSIFVSTITARMTNIPNIFCSMQTLRRHAR